MNEVQAYPSKSFFVGMLTRDIELADAVLDLLDNCLDGILRKEELNSETPYAGHHAKLTIDKNQFIIQDNCGGIPREIAVDHAFRMGRKPTREDEDIPTIGMYGIGMKRAMFKMGKNINVYSQHVGEKAYNVNINSSWLSDDDNWELDLNEWDDLGFEGTIIHVEDLHPGISKMFGTTSSFVSDMMAMISTHYAYIIKKGLQITINGNDIKPQTMSLLFSKNFSDGAGIIPYIYSEKHDDLEINIIVGIVGQPPSLEEDAEDAEAKSHKKSAAGWTIICNDRVVLYGDKSRITGWGDRGIPQFHYQFNTIVGIVEFKSNDSSKLPVTTTKKGLDTSSDLYLRIKNKMLEGLRKYLTYTNRWKNSKELEREIVIDKTISFEITDIETVVKEVEKTVTFSTARDGFRGRFSSFNLVEPPKEKKDTKIIRFTKKISDIQMVSEYITDGNNLEIDANEIGETCFDLILEKAKKA